MRIQFELTSVLTLMRRLLSRAMVVGVFFVLVLTSVYTYTRVSGDAVASAATSSNLNFQARILNSSGSVVPDGNYNIEFKLYDAVTSSGSSQGSCTGDTNCIWTETRTGANRVRVVNGYFSANLGSVSAFPSTVKWDQEHWLTMNIGGITGPTWDGEMTPRLKLTATPYALVAGQLRKTVGANTSIFDFLNPTGNRTINLPDASGTALLDSTGFANGGNNFTGLASIGTTSNFGLDFVTNNTIRAGFDTSNNVTFGNGGSSGLAGSPTAFTLRGTGSFTTGTVGAGLSILGGGGATTTTGSAGGGLSLLGGNAGGTGNNNGGNVSIDGGTSTGIGNGGIINIGGNNAFSLNLGRSGVTTSVLGALSVSGGTNFGVYYKDSTGNLSTTGAGTTGQCFLGNTGLAPSWGSCAGSVNLQNSYTNSAATEIVVDSTRGGLTLRDNAAPIGTNLLEIQNNGGGTTYFSVGATGTTVNGGLIQSGGAISLTGNGVSTISTSSGNITIQAGSGTVSLGTTTALTSSGVLTLSSGSGALTLDSASNTLSIASSDTGLQRIAAGTYTIDLSNAAATTLSLNNTGAGAVTLDLVDGGLNVASTSVLTNARLLQNLTGLTVSSGGASISGGFNNNTGGITNAGSIAGITTINASGLITGTSGLTISGASVSLNDSSNFNTSINTGTSTGTIAIGGGSSPFALNSTAFDVSSAGALSGITTLSATGAITATTATNTINGLIVNSGGLSGVTGYSQISGNFAQTGTGTFSTGTGGVSLNSATTIANSTTSSALSINQTGNGSVLSATNSAITSGALVSLTHNTSAFTGTGLLMNIASGSGSFASGNFLDFQINGTSRFKVDNAGALQVTSDSANGINVQSTGGISYFRVDVAGSAVRIGSATADATGVLLVLDTKNTAGDPTGVNGGSYYNSNTNKVRCYQNNIWQDCLPASYTNVTLAADQDTWTNMPAADTEYFGTRTRNWVDLTNAREFRLVAGIAVAGFAGADCRIQYATSDAGPWTNLDGALGPELLVDSIATQKMAWSTIATGARAEVVVRIMCKDGNGTIDPQFRGVHIQIR